MAYYIAIYDWSLYTTPAALSTANIEGDSHPNDPAAPIYDSGSPSWIGETFTFNGGAQTLIEVDDDDANFEDGYVETGGIQTLASDVTINGTTYTAGMTIQNEFSMIDGSGNQVWVVAINGVNVGFAYASGEHPTSGQTFTGAEGIDGDPADNANGTSSSTAPYSGIICFASGTQIGTPWGNKLIETFQVGDLVSTTDFGPMKVRWLARTELAGATLTEDRKPIRISAGALGPGLPSAPLVVSPQHRVLLSGPVVTQTCWVPEVLAPARGLTGLAGVRVMKGRREVTYHHLLLERHAVIRAEAAETESFYPGPMALAMMGAGDRARLEKSCPGILQDARARYGPLARAALTVAETRKLVRALQASCSDAVSVAAPFAEAG